MDNSDREDYSTEDNIKNSCDNTPWLFWGLIIVGCFLVGIGLIVGFRKNGLYGLLSVPGVIFIIIGSIQLFNHNKLCKQYTDDKKEYETLLPKLKRSDYELTDKERKFIKALKDNYPSGTFEDLKDNYEKWKNICYNVNCHNGSGVEKNGECKCICNDDDFEGDDCNTRDELHNYDQDMDLCTDEDGTKNELVPEEKCMGEWRNYTIPGEDKKTITNKDSNKIKCIDPKYCRNYCQRNESEWCQHGLVNNTLYNNRHGRDGRDGRDGRHGRHGRDDGDGRDSRDGRYDGHHYKYNRHGDHFFNEYGVNHVPVCLDKRENITDKCLHEEHHRDYIHLHCEQEFTSDSECNNHSTCKWNASKLKCESSHSNHHDNGGSPPAPAPSTCKNVGVSCNSEPDNCCGDLTCVSGKCNGDEDKTDNFVVGGLATI